MSDIRPDDPAPAVRHVVKDDGKRLDESWVVQMADKNYLQILGMMGRKARGLDARRHGTLVVAGENRTEGTTPRLGFVPLELTALWRPGREWVQQFLEQWGLSLSRAVTREIDLTAGTVYGYVAPTSAPTEASRFAQILVPHPGAASFDAVLELVRAIGGGLLIVEIGQRAKHRDIGVTRNGRRLTARNVALHHDELLLWRRLSSGSADEIFADIDERDPAFVVGGPDIEDLLPAEELSDERLSQLARVTQCILVSAFDGDAVVVWTRAQIPDGVRSVVFRAASSSERVAPPN